MKTAGPLSKTCLLVACASHVALSHAFQSTPVMGWNSYNQMSCSPNAQKIEDTINALADRGFVDSGYVYFQIDCGWASRDGQRNATSGALKIDLDAFPDGLAPLSQLARSKGMKWSMYSDAGYLMCDPQVPSPVLGSLDHETADAKLFQSLHTEYLKYDNCYAGGTSAGDNAPKDPRTDFVTRYGKMWDALQQVGISGMLVCEWGVPYSTSTGLEGPAQWTKGLATSFRLSDDVGPSWSNVYRIYNQAVYIANSGLVGPGHFADADLLEVGNSGMTDDEQATQFAAWAMLKSALMISTDIAALSDATVAVLQNRGLIAINQDSAGQPVRLVQRWTSDRDLWVGDLANDDLAVLMVDLSNTQRELTLNLADIGLTSATIENLWTGEAVISTGSYSAQVNAHGSLPLRLSNMVHSLENPPSYNFISANTGTLSNGAVTEPCSGCTSSSKVGYLGGSSGGEVVLANIRTSQATQNVRFDYINCEVGYGGSTNERLAAISINGGSSQTVSFPLSGYNWVEDVYRNYTVELSGFNTNGPNTLSITGVGGGWAPDLDRIGIVA